MSVLVLLDDQEVEHHNYSDQQDNDHASGLQVAYGCPNPLGFVAAQKAISGHKWNSVDLSGIAN